jgi:endogenous inhibitor of DNA gyrase (YacG/DUF329 family)
MKTNEEKIMDLLRNCVVIDESGHLDVKEDFFARLQCLTQAQEGREGEAAKIKCPHCQSTILWSEDRGAHCDGCDDFDPEADLPEARPIPSPGAEGDTKRLEAVRFAWEAGFKLCQSYGDNWIHFGGQQKERQWKWFLESAGYAHFYPTDASRLPRTQEVQS